MGPSQHLAALSGSDFSILDMWDGLANTFDAIARPDSMIQESL